MKYVLKTYLLLMLSVVICSCSNKNDEVNYYQPSGPLTATISQSSTKAGTPISIQFTGYADSLIFWSGKEGHMYAYRERTTMDGVIPKLSFTSYRQWGAQENTLQLMVSNQYDVSDTDISAAISQANWMDVTARATLSLGADNTPSGEIDLSDFLITSDPLVIAFKFTGAAGSTQRTWTLKNVSLKSYLPNGVINELANTSTAGWIQYSYQNASAVWTYNSSQLQIVGGNATAESNEDWVISSPLYVNNVSPDQGQVIKVIYQTMLKSYLFVYDEPGVYQAVIEGKNADGTSSGPVQTFQITVTE